jgi:hypothetical protein
MCAEEGGRAKEIEFYSSVIAGSRTSDLAKVLLKNVKVDIDFGSRRGKTTFPGGFLRAFASSQCITQTPVARLYRQEAPPTLDDSLGRFGDRAAVRVANLSRPSHTYDDSAAQREPGQWRTPSPVPHRTYVRIMGSLIQLLM